MYREMGGSKSSTTIHGRLLGSLAFVDKIRARAGQAESHDARVSIMSAPLDDLAAALAR
jgi:hypothetical protein